MNPSIPPSKTNPPAWQREHAATLHKICSWIAARQAKGKKLSRSVAFFVRGWNGKPYRTDPNRRLQISQTTLYRVYAQWRTGGSTPSAVRLEYRHQIGDVAVNEELALIRAEDGCHMHTAVTA